MSDPDKHTRSILHKASQYVKADKIREARQVLRKLLLSDQDNLEAWKLLAEISEHNDEKAFCQGQIQRLSQAQNRVPESKSVREELLPPEKPVIMPSSAIPSPNMWTTEALPGQDVPPFEEEKRVRKSSRAPLWAGIFLVGCLGLWGIALLSAGFLPGSQPVNLTATFIAENNAYCQALVENALKASGNFCDQIGPNKVCYGNITLQAELQADATDRFSQRGDVVAVERLRRLIAAPLDLNSNEWGVAIFKVMANLPSSLPGQTVTMMVFGNTVLDNRSDNLEAFYFFNQLGRIVCEKAMYDGLLITMPDGAGIQFMVNGTELTLMGDASLTATRNGEMEVTMHSGSGVIVADGVEKDFSAGEKVSVPLGGPDGTEAIGPPSDPESLSDEERENICLLTGEQCADELTQTASQPTLPPTSTRTATSTRTTSPTPSRTFTPSPTITNTLWYKTLTASRTPTTALTIINTPTRSRTPRPTRTPRPGGGPTDTPAPTATFTATPTATLTSTPSFTPTNTPVSGLCTTEAFAGSLDNPGGLTDLTMDITNSSGATVTISEIRVVWDVATAVEIKQVFLGLVIPGTTNISNPNLLFSPITIPVDSPFAGTITRRQIDNGDTKTMTIGFLNNLSSGTGYSVRVTLAEVFCYVQASR